jgi:hypothetical protein
MMVKVPASNRWLDHLGQLEGSLLKRLSSKRRQHEGLTLHPRITHDPGSQLEEQGERNYWNLGRAAYWLNDNLPRGTRCTRKLGE